MEHFESTIDLYRQMAANIPDCSIYVFDENFDYLLAEGEEVSKLGFASKSLVGCNFFDIWPQEVTVTMSPYYLDTLAGKRQKLEQTTEEGVFIQHFIPIFDKDKNVIAGMVVSQNVSILSEIRQELNVRDEELKNKQHLFETVINTVGEGIIVSNPKGEIVLSNPAANALLSMHLQGKKLNEVSENILIKNTGSKAELQPKELPFWMALQGARLDGYTTQVEFRGTNKITHIENSARPLKNSKKEIEGAVLVMRDVSARKELEDIVEENLAVTKEKSVRLEHFMTILSQNLLGPAANLNILYSLLEKSKSQTEHEAYISKIGEVAKTLQETVATISGSVQKYSAMHKQWVVNYFNETIARYAEGKSQLLKEKQVTLVCDFEGEEKMAYPCSQFDFIIGNALDNILQLCALQTEVHLQTCKENDLVKLKIVAGNFAELQADWENTSGEKLSQKYEGLAKAKEQVEVLGGKLQVGHQVVQITF